MVVILKSVPAKGGWIVYKVKKATKASAFPQLEEFLNCVTLTALNHLQRMKTNR